MSQRKAIRASQVKAWPKAIRAEKSAILNAVCHFLLNLPLAPNAQGPKTLAWSEAWCHHGGDEVG